MRSHAVELIAPHSDVEMPTGIERGVCAVTGKECDTVPRGELLSKSFTSGDLLRAPNSDRVGVAAYLALRYKWERMSSWIVTESEFRRLDRVGVREAALGNPPAGVWAAYATTSYKKHGALLAPVNSGDRSTWVFETRPVDMSQRDVVREWWERLNTALRLGLGRSVLESLTCPPFLVRKVGVREWLAFDAWARPRYQSPLYAFLCYLLPSQEELRAEAKDEPDSAARVPDSVQTSLL